MYIPINSQRVQICVFWIQERERRSKIVRDFNQLSSLGVHWENWLIEYLLSTACGLSLWQNRRGSILSAIHCPPLCIQVAARYQQLDTVARRQGSCLKFMSKWGNHRKLGLKEFQAISCPLSTSHRVGYAIRTYFVFGTPVTCSAAAISTSWRNILPCFVK